MPYGRQLSRARSCSSIDRQGWLLEELDRAGCGPQDIDVVFLTHLHSDHFGWCVDRGVPTFPNARYITHRAGWEWTNTRERSAYAAQLRPLEDARVLTTLDGTTELAQGVRAFDTPGHAPGHMSVDISSGDEHLVILGDVAVHPVQLSDPAISYSLDVDADLAIETRAGLLERIFEEEPLVACGHYPAAFGRLRRYQRGGVWEAG